MTTKDILNLLSELVDIPAPVGREDAVQHFLADKWEKLNFKTEIDKIGNLYGRISGSGPHWAIVSHADTIGFIVQQILSNGFLKMAFNTAATTPDARFLPGSTLQFLTKNTNKTLGYFGLRSGHLAGIEGKKEPVLFDDMFVDIGVDSIKDVLDLGIDIGSSAVFHSSVQQIQNNIVGPSMDNRVGSTIQTVLAERIMKKKIHPNLTLISTVQEEIGMKGAAAAARNGEFDAVINIDVGLTGDIPPSEKDFLSTKLGSGPILVVKDFSVHYSHSLFSTIENKAINDKIPFQKAVFKNYNTDGMYFFMNGHPTIAVSVPCRYTHTNFETINLSDVLHSINLLEAVIFDSLT
ncbi:MAG: M42 family metallopeptidase [Candidatus Hodarchaeales archaeon]